jgi:hypothetical protein
MLIRYAAQNLYAPLRIVEEGLDDQAAYLGRRVLPEFPVKRVEMFIHLAGKNHYVAGIQIHLSLLQNSEFTQSAHEFDRDGSPRVGSVKTGQSGQTRHCETPARGAVAIHEADRLPETPWQSKGRMDCHGEA